MIFPFDTTCVLTRFVGSSGGSLLEEDSVEGLVREGHVTAFVGGGELVQKCTVLTVLYEKES